jgi:CheY-like chemotaxis protein
MEAASNRLLRGSRVLVVEDDPFIAFDIVKTLRGAGAETLGPAMSLARALELATTEDPDCAVLDVMMRDGLIFPAASILNLRRVGIVFYTGYADVESLTRNWPASKVLLKPAQPKLLVHTVRAACHS